MQIVEKECTPLQATGIKRYIASSYEFVPIKDAQVLQTMLFLRPSSEEFELFYSGQLADTAYFGAQNEIPLGAVAR